MSNIEQPEKNRLVRENKFEEELPVEMIEAFSRLGVEREKIHLRGLMRNRTYRVEVGESGLVRSFVYKEIKVEYGRTLADILQDQNASRILEERIGYPTRKLLILEPRDDPRCAILDFIDGERGGIGQNELLIPEKILLIAGDLRKIHKATETEFYSRSNEAIPSKESDIPYQDFCISYSVNDIQKLDIPNKEQITETIREAARHVMGGKFSLIHGDVNQFNIVWKDPEHPVLIDWGYSEFGDPSRDIANLLLHIHKDDRIEFEKILPQILSMYKDSSKQLSKNLQFYLGLRYLTYGRVGLVRAGDPTALKKIEDGYNLLKDFSK